MRRSFADLWALLNRRERRRFAVLVAMTCVAGLLDALGIASLLPFLALVANPGMVETNPALSWLSGALGDPAPNDLLAAVGILVLVAVAVGLTARAAAFYALTRFVRMRELTLGRQLLARYLARPYAWFLGRHSADLGKSLLSEVQQVVAGPFDAAIRLIANAVVALFIVLVLVAVDPYAALGAALIVGGGVRDRQPAPARADPPARARAHPRQPRALPGHARGAGRHQGRQDPRPGADLPRALRGAREPARPHPGARHHHRRDAALRAGGHRLRGHDPVRDLAPEGEDGSLESALPALGAYAFAGVRLFPAMQDIFRATTRLRFGAPALSALREELSGPAPLPPEAQEGPPMPLRDRITIEDVSFAYPGAEGTALSELSLEIEAGSVVGIVGSTGAGKSTLVDLILGLLEPDEGEIAADGVVLRGEVLRRWRRSIGYVPQTIFLTDDTVAANVAFGLAPEEIDMDRVAEAVRQAQLDEVVAALPGGLMTPVGERGARLSGGQRQRVGIARALYREPPVLVFDEATSALDTVTERALMRTIGALAGQRTIVMIAHRLSSVRQADRIFLLEHGRLAAAGRYGELVERSAAFRRLHEAGA